MIIKIHKLLIFFVSFASISIAAEKQATVRLKVVNEANEPVPHAEVLIIFGGIQQENNARLTSKTNEDGLLKAMGWSKGKFLSSVTVISKEPSYYQSVLTAHAQPEDREFDLRLMVRAVQNPTPMYAKKILMRLPEQRKEIGFDFEKSDWVKPHGKGEVADCFFFGTKTFEDFENNKTSVIMSFPGELDGLIIDPLMENADVRHSKFKTAREAPIEGYVNIKEFVSRSSTDRGYAGTTKPSNYIFRARTILDQQGKLQSCHHGKLVNAVDVHFGAGKPDTNPVVSFTYYFNPTPNDRNLEFEPKENLFGALEWDEEVREP
ncbi:MAG: hypothetical protein ACO3SO_01000 [Luteolibacter sp.]